MQHTTWSAAEGMTFSPRGALLQTPDGYLWIGTRGALMRFDGVRFAVVDSATSPLLRTDSTGLLRPLLVDRDGVMWIARDDGALLHYRQGRFTLAVAAETGRETPAEVVQDRTGRIWFTIRSALYTLDDGRVRRARLPAGVPDTNVTDVVPDTGSGVWVGTVGRGLWHVVGERAERLPIPRETSAARAFLQSSDGRLWVWGPEGLMVTNGTRWSTVLADGVTQIAPMAVVESPDRDVWIGTQAEGLLRVSGLTTEHFSKRHGLADAVVRDVLVDRERNVWVLTEWALERFRTTPFTTLGVADSVPFETPSKISADERGGLWVMSMTDRRLFQATGGVVAGDGQTVRWSAPTFAHRGAHQPLGAARGGGVLVWSDSDGVQRVRNGGVITTLARSPQLNAAVVRALYEDSLGAVWAGWIPRGPGPGFARIKDGVATPVRLEVGRESGRVSTIADDGHGHLWVNNVARPVIYKLAGDSVVARIDSTAGIHAVVTVIVPQGPDTLWMLTNRSSLLRVVGRTATRVRFVGDDDFLALPWASLARDEHALWIATSGGIARLDFAALHAAADGRGPMPRPRVYGASDGLINAHVPWTVVNAAAVANDGRMWFSTSGGLAVYDSRFDRSNAAPPAVHIEEIVAAGTRVSSASPEIPPRPDRVEIHFTAVDLRTPEKVRLEYMLEGADHDWVTAGKQRTATYTQLRAGDYRFRVRAWNEDGVSSVAESALALRVVPAWYEAGWFRALAVLVGLAVGPFVVFQMLHRRARRREAELHARFDAALEERNRIARELHDTLLQGFGGITLQLHMIAHTMAASPTKAAARLDGVLRLADDTLVDARQMIWDLRAPELAYQDLSDALAAAARNAIVDAPIEFQFHVRGQERRLPPLLETTALRIGREAATNAARHARPSRIEIELVYGDRHLDLRVQDDGSGLGIDPSSDQRLNGHWGIAGMRERAARAGGALDISSTAGSGTTVSLQLPI